MHQSSYYILLSLHEEDRHGYGIAKRSEELSDGRVKMTAGTLYGALDRLSNEDLIQVTREERVEGRMRRYYRVTPKGRNLAAEEMQRLRAMAETGGRIIGLEPGGAPA